MLMSEYDEEKTGPKTDRVRVRRFHERGQYEKALVYDVLDAGFLCHVGYLIDGSPMVTPTLYWREDNYVYWHGSAASRTLKAAKGHEVCLTVSHFDGFVMARSAFNHSVNYRCAMLVTWNKSKPHFVDLLSQEQEFVSWLAGRLPSSF